LFYFNPLFRLVEFTSGMCLALLWSCVRERWRPRVLIATTSEVAAVALITLSLYEYPNLYALTANSGLIGPSLQVWLAEGGFSLVGACALVLVFALDQGLLSRLLSLPMLLALGEMSYVMYLLHAPLIYIYATHVRAFSWLPEWLQYSLFWAFLLVSSLLIWRWVERPARDAIRRIVARMLGPPLPLHERTLAVPVAARPTSPWRWLRISELGGFALLLAFFAYTVVWRPAIEVVANDEAAQVAAATPASLRDVQFGDAFMLKGIRTTRGTSGLTLELVWQALRPVTLSYMNAVHLLDAQGQIVGQESYSQDATHPTVEGGQAWKDVVTIPDEELMGVTTLGLGIYSASEPSLLQISKGPRDWDDHRLLLDLQELQAGATQP
jgi:hypothetical protein